MRASTPRAVRSRACSDPRPERVFDAHLHLEHEVYAGSREDVWRAATARGLTGAVIPGFDVTQWERASRVRALEPSRIHMAVGVHPWAMRRAGACDEGHTTRSTGRAHDGSDASEPRTRLGRTLADGIALHRPVAVGECGLDRARADRVPLEAQRRALQVHLEVARAHDLPVILHVVRAHGAALDTLNQYAPLRGVLHGFGGSWEVAERYLSLGLMLGFGASLHRAGAKRAKEAFRRVPADRFTLETDAPDQSPGDYCSAMSDVTGAADQLRPELDGAASVGAANARRLFRLHPETDSDLASRADA